MAEQESDNATIQFGEIASSDKDADADASSESTAATVSFVAARCESKDREAKKLLKETARNFQTPGTRSPRRASGLASAQEDRSENHDRGCVRAGSGASRCQDLGRKCVSHDLPQTKPLPLGWVDPYRSEVH